MDHHLPPERVIQLKDYQLLDYLLKPKMCGEKSQLQNNTPIINDVNVYNHHPSHFFDGQNTNSVAECYFFTRLKKISNNQRNRNYNRRVDNLGKWEGNYIKKICDHQNNVIGFNKYFQFEELNKKDRTIIDDDDGVKVEWKMHEYSFDSRFLPKDVKEENKELVLCKILMKVKGKKETLKRSQEDSDGVLSKKQVIGVSENCLSLLWTQIIDDKVSCGELDDDDEKQIKEEKDMSKKSGSTTEVFINLTNNNVKGNSSEGLKYYDAGGFEFNQARTVDDFLTIEDLFPSEDNLTSDLQRQFVNLMAKFCPRVTSAI
ncbi:NAC domain-containing protein 60 [Bienertia sinuspersici]